MTVERKRKFWGPAVGLAFVTFAVALALRLLNFPWAFEHGKPAISPLDELYHWKRISYSALHFPRVLELDAGRGDGGAFCPWPPLYDLSAGAAARLLGARDADAVLARAVWFPPVVFAAFVAAAVLVLARACGAFTAIVAGCALAASPFLVTTSWIGSIDHHFLEPIFVFGIVGATLAVGPFGSAQGRRWQLAAAMTAAMFVQTALVIAAGLAFAVLFVRGRRDAALAFAIPAVLIALYRLTRPPGYPNSQWFLGWTHVALFAAAAVALSFRRRWLGLALGVLVVAPFLPQVLAGAHFFRGDAWLMTISEFQPVWRARGQDLLSIVAGLGAGAILVWPLALKRHPVAFFAIVYLILTIVSRRFWIIAIPLLALSGAIYAGKRLVLALLVAVPPPLQLAGWLITQPIPAIQPEQRAWLAKAAWLRTQPPGRVLAPWSMGHALDVLGQHAVIIDNFGSMPDPALFDAANAALAGRDLETFCREHKVRYVIR